MSCTHLDTIQDVTPSVPGCEDCLVTGDRWVHLRLCLECGHVGINTAQRNHEAPFGGFKMSGIGRDGGDYGLHAYTEIQSVIWPG